MLASEKCRQRAVEARAEATRLLTPERAMLLDIAALYEKLAQQAEIIRVLARDLLVPN